jgi:hypothetical protein
MIKYTTALRLGTAETEAILRRFTKQNLQHPTYKAFAELGKAIKSELFWANQRPPPGKKSASSIASTSLRTEACRPNPSSLPLTWPPLKPSLTSKTANSPCPNVYAVGFAISQTA